MNLSELKPGESCIIESVALPDSEQEFLERFGFHAGAAIRCLRCAPLGDPVVYAMDGTEVALRMETAARIIVK